NFGLCSHFMASCFRGRIIPTVFQPGGNLPGRIRRGTQFRPPHFEDKVFFAGLRGSVLHAGNRRIRTRSATPDGRMDRKLMEPHAPELTTKLPLHWIPMLIQRFQIAEDSCDLFTCWLESSGTFRPSL